jgi:isopenicillin N synthase-like dioxygenase
MTGAFDPNAKERELQQESAEWDTSSPVPAGVDDIPTIDVSEYFASRSTASLREAAELLRVASEEVGFYQLVGHGISNAETDAILSATRRFHALPLETKQTVLMDRADWPIGGVGFMPIGERKLPQRAKGNLNEAYFIKSDRTIDFDDNQWLPDSVLPGFRQQVESYAAAISDVALSLLPIYATALDLVEDFFTPAFSHPFWRLRMTRYPPDPPTSTDDEFGIAPHVDTTFFTLLLQDGPGLKIFSHRRNMWISAPVVPDAFVVNSGELLRQWSNDRFLSTRHFANNPPAANGAELDRYSVPFFFNANADYPMECLPSCHGPGNPRKYPTISYLESQGVAQGE